METGCQQMLFDFQELGKSKIVAEFNGGTISTDSGALLLRAVDHGRDILKQFHRLP